MVSFYLACLYIFIKHNSCLELCFDPSACAPNLFISDNNRHLRKNVSIAAYHSCRALGAGWTHGVHYWSMRIIDRESLGYITIGIVSKAFDVSLSQYVGQTSSSYGICLADGKKYFNNTATEFISTANLPKNDDVIGILLDLDAQTLTYFKNGKLLGTAFGQIPLSTKYYPAVSFYQLGAWISLIKTTK